MTEIAQLRAVASIAILVLPVSRLSADRYGSVVLPPVLPRPIAVVPHGPVTSARFHERRLRRLQRRLGQIVTPPAHVGLLESRLGVRHLAYPVRRMRHGDAVTARAPLLFVTAVTEVPAHRYNSGFDDLSPRHSDRASDMVLMALVAFRRRRLSVMANHAPVHRGAFFRLGDSRMSDRVMAIPALRSRIQEIAVPNPNAVAAYRFPGHGRMTLKAGRIGNLRSPRLLVSIIKGYCDPARVIYFLAQEARDAGLLMAIETREILVPRFFEGLALLATRVAVRAEAFPSCVVA